MALINMETFQMESCVRDCHVYKDIREAIVGERLECQREHDYPSDAYAVAVKKGGTIVGHLPQKLSCLCAFFIRRGGSISCSYPYSKTKILIGLDTRRVRNPLFTVL